MIDIQKTKKEDFREDVPVVPTPPGHTPKDHIVQSVLAIAVSYFILAALVIVGAMVTGTIAIPHSVLPYVVVLSPIFAAFAKDFFHWMQTGQWSVTSNE